MAEHDSAEDVQIFEDLSLEEKMIEYEQGLVTHSRKLVLLFQDIIDDGQVWQKDFPRHTHYARMCAFYLRKAACHLYNTVALPPDEIYDEHYLYQDVYEGYDVWGRTPIDVDWGRPLRWQEIRKGLITKFKETQDRKKQGLPVAPPFIDKRGCCGK